MRREFSDLIHIQAHPQQRYGAARVIMSVSNFFELFGLPMVFRLDAQLLENAYRQLLAKVHPDRYTQASDADRRASMQWATAANEAVKSLRSPVGRARHLLALHGVDVQAETNTQMSSGFLMQQMEWREALDEARGNQSPHHLARLEADVQDASRSKTEHLAHLLDDAHDWPGAATAVRELMFIEKFRGSVEQAIDALPDSGA